MENGPIRMYSTKTHFLVPHAFMKHWIADLNKIETAILLTLMEQMELAGVDELALPYQKMAVLTGSRVQSMAKCIGTLEMIGILQVRKDVTHSPNQWPRNIYRINWELLERGPKLFSDAPDEIMRQSTKERRRRLLEEKVQKELVSQACVASKMTMSF